MATNLNTAEVVIIKERRHDAFGVCSGCYGRSMGKETRTIKIAAKYCNYCGCKVINIVTVKR